MVCMCDIVWLYTFVISILIVNSEWGETTNDTARTDVYKMKDNSIDRINLNPDGGEKGDFRYNYKFSKQKIMTFLVGCNFITNISIRSGNKLKNVLYIASVLCTILAHTIFKSKKTLKYTALLYNTI